jgi:hypothetical protein
VLGLSVHLDPGRSLFAFLLAVCVALLITLGCHAEGSRRRRAGNGMLFGVLQHSIL